MTLINKFQFQYWMKNSQRAKSTPNTVLRKFSINQQSNNSNNPLLETQKVQKPNSELQIVERHQQLNNYIDELEIKIAKIVEFNQAQVLLAYSNHFIRVREQIQLFKEEALNEIKIESSVIERMEKMQRQLLVFREEALRLFGLLLDKDKIIQKLKLKIDEMEAQKKYMDKRAKQLLKNDKAEKVKGAMIENIDSQTQQKSHKFSQMGNSFCSIGFHAYKKNKQFDRKNKDKKLTASNYRHKVFGQDTIGVRQEKNLSISNHQSQYKQAQQLELNSLIKDQFNYLQSSIAQDIVKKTGEHFQANNHHSSLFQTKTVNSTQFKRTRYSLRSKTYTGKQLSQNKKNRVSNLQKKVQVHAARQDGVRNELTLYFQRCVNLVKHDIAHRTKRATVNFFTEGKAISMQDFKKIDLLRLIQMVFTNEKLTKILFQAIFGKNKLSIFSQF